MSHASPMTRRNSGDLEDLSEEETKMRRRPVFAKKSRSGWPWPPVDLQDEEDFAARALSLTMVGLLARIRVLFQEKGRSRIPGEEPLSINGGKAETELGEEQRRLLVAIMKKVVGAGSAAQEEEIEGWIKAGFPRMQKYAALHQKINKNLLKFYVANKYGKKQDLSNIGRQKRGWEERQTETYGEAENIRKIFELFRYKKQEKIENEDVGARNALVIGFSLEVGLQEEGMTATKLIKTNEGPNMTRPTGEVNMINVSVKKETTGVIDFINNA